MLAKQLHTASTLKLIFEGKNNQFVDSITRIVPVKKFIDNIFVKTNDMALVRYSVNPKN